jgi:exodeoxyribonuclease V gamma subunit
VLHVHHADRADHLVAALADVLRVPPADPFQREVVAVHSRGIERWVAQQLSLTLGAGDGRRDGIAANLDFPFPGRLVGDAIVRASGADPDRDPWRPDRLTWPLLEVVDDDVRAGRTAELGPLAVHLTHHDGDGVQRLGAVRRVADLFDRYATHRPALLQAWATGSDVDGSGRQLGARHRWQARLWRRLREAVAVPSAPERLDHAVATLRGGVDAGVALDLPDRLALFGLTALPVTYLDVLEALAVGPTATAPDGREVHLFLLHPSPALWRRVAGHLAAADAATRAAPATTATALPTRDQDPTRDLPRHPFLAAWGRDARELQLVVSAARADQHDPPAAEEAAEGARLLARLQADVRADRAPWSPGEPDDRAVLATDDASVQVHRCHGRTRQVEVLRDVLLGILADHPDLEPRDVVVLCPDIETFAPLVEAVFGSHAVADGAGGGGDLRVQLADRALRRTNPVLRVVAEVLDLVDGRLTASSVLDLSTRAPVRLRFGFDDHDLERLEERLDSAGVRWGLDGAHREALGVPTEANTWRAGLDRLLVGVAVDDDALRTVGRVPPDPDVEGEDVDLVGRLAELVARLGAAIEELRGPHPLDAWLRRIAAVADELCLVPTDQTWQRLQLTRLLDDVRDAADVAGARAALPLTLGEVRDLLDDRLRGAPSRAAHRTGDLTVCTLVPMRSVPHEVVVLLGMDDEVFPRRTVPDGDDLLAEVPLVGDRDARTEDRQLLLDALLAARSHLVVLTTGHDERTNEPRPAAVPIGELLDVVDRTVRGDREGRPVPASSLVTVDHPLQPFSPARFTPGAVGGPNGGSNRPFGFDLDDLAAAEAAAGPSADPPPFLQLDAALPTAAAPDVHDVVDLADLAAFLVHPCRELLRQRLHLSFPRDGEATGDAVPVELPRGLARWEVGDRLFAAVARGGDLARAVEVERRRGALPPGRLADDALDDITATITELLRAADELGIDLATPGTAIDVDVTLPSGTRVQGTVADVVGTTRRASSYSKLGPQHRLRAWIDLLALTVQDPTRPWTAVTLGNGRDEASTKQRRSAVASLSRIGPHDEIAHPGPRHRTLSQPGHLADGLGPEARRARATAALEDLVSLRRRGLRGPVPLPCKTAHAYAYARFKADIGFTGSDATSVAAKRWTTGDNARYANEDGDDANRLLLGELTFAELLELPATDDEDGDGWFVDREVGRFGRLARRVWEPLLRSEQLEDRW